MRTPVARRLLVALATTLSAIALFTPRAHARPPIVFDTHTLKVPGRVLDVTHFDMDGDGREDLVVTHLSGDGKTAKDSRGCPLRYVSVWLQHVEPPRWHESPDLTREVPLNAVAFAVGDFDPAPGGEVAFLGADGVSLLKLGPDKQLLSAVASITTGQGFFDFPASSQLPLWSLSPDLGQHRQDLLVPVREGYLLLRNESGKGLTPRGTIKVPSNEGFGSAYETKFLNRFLSYHASLPRLVAIETSGTGRKDLVVYRKKGLARFLQKPDGTFGESPDDEKPLSVIEDAEKKTQKKESQNGKTSSEAFSNVRVALVDLDKDGFADLVATKTVGELGIFETLRTQILICKGSKDGWQEGKPERILNEKGVATDPEFLDLDGDGLPDIVVSSIRMDHFTNLKRAITKSITITYSIYLQTKDGFPEEPDFRRDVEVDVDALETRNGAAHASFDADLNGDKLRDMIVRQSRDKLRVHWGSIESGWFSGKKLAFKEDESAEITVPPNSDVEVKDLYKDGKGDALVISNPNQNDPERMTIRIVEVHR